MKGNALARTQAPYPLFVKLDGKRTVVVGAGNVATRKVAALLDYGAAVTLVAPDATERLQELARFGAIAWKTRRYRTGDLDGAVLAIAATSDRNLNAQVSHDAQANQILVNVVDEPDLCTCITPSTMQRGQLQVAVSTNGASPSTARAIRQAIERSYPAWWETYIDLLADVRALVKERVPREMASHALLFETIASSGLEKRIASGEVLDAEDAYDGIIRPLLSASERPCGDALYDKERNSAPQRASRGGAR